MHVSVLVSRPRWCPRVQTVKKTAIEDCTHRDAWVCHWLPDCFHAPLFPSVNVLHMHMLGCCCMYPCRHTTAAAGLPQSPSSHSSIQQLNIAAAHGAAIKHDQQSPEAGSGGGSGGSSRTRPWGPGRGGDGDGDGPGQQLVCPHTTLLQQLLAVLSSLLFSMLLPAPSQAAAAASKRSGLVSKHDERMESSWQLDAFVDRMWDLSSPIINNMGFSGLVGACAAAALKVRDPAVWSCMAVVTLAWLPTAVEVWQVLCVDTGTANPTLKHTQAHSSTQ
jgi:hypothetical protein